MKIGENGNKGYFNVSNQRLNLNNGRRSRVGGEWLFTPFKFLNLSFNPKYFKKYYDPCKKACAEGNLI